jgi:trans-2,3-dihydro-3-hydroxyanthranilate isomerase
MRSNRSYPFFYVDAFTSKAFEGNPCAVFPDAGGLSDGEMQNLAKETNLSETAFVFESGKAGFRVRYFTPVCEIPFAGHPTIATAYILAREGHIKTPGRTARVEFEFNIGVLPVEVLFSADGEVDTVAMWHKPPVFGECLDPKSLAGLMGLGPEDFLPNVPVQAVSTGVPFLMVPLKTPDLVAKAALDRQRIKKLLENFPAKNLFVFAPRGFSGEGDTFARLMDPDNAGEDSYTGSATGCMGCYLYRYGIIKKPRMVCEQGHLMGRPGTGILELEGTPENITQVKLFGKGTVSLKGEYTKLPSRID